MNNQTCGEVESFLEFDFDDFDLAGFDDSSFQLPASTSEVSEPAGTSTKLKVVKVSKRVYHKKKSPFKRGMSVSEALTAGGAMPNMSRRPPSSVLVAFPHFDKCDSLIYFPHTMTRHMNSSDKDAFVKLFSKHLAKECTIKINFGKAGHISADDFIRFWDISNDVEPDRIACAHSTKVDENQIKSIISMKLTDCQPLYNLISKTAAVREKFLGMDMLLDRHNRFLDYTKEGALPESLVHHLMSQAHLEHDVVVHLQCDIVMTFDNTTKKVTHMSFIGRLTSAHPVVAPPQNQLD